MVIFFSSYCALTKTEIILLNVDLPSSYFLPYSHVSLLCLDLFLFQYLSCVFPQAEGACKCNGWKSQNPPPTPPRTDQQSSAVNLQEPCRSCSHTLGESFTLESDDIVSPYFVQIMLLSLLLTFLKKKFFLTQGDHVTHLENVSEEEMNRLLGIVLDVEYLYTCVHKEEDADTKQVYFSLFKVSLSFYTQNIFYSTLLFSRSPPLFCCSS